MKKMLALLLAFILALPMVASSESATAALQEMYAQAELLMVQGDYAGAAAKFEALGAYSDASQMTMYCKAIAAAETLGLYSMAVDTFNDLGDFKDSKQMAQYYQGRSYEAYGNVNVATASDSDLDKALWGCQEAEKVYGGLAFFKDSLTRMAACGEKIKEIKNEQSARTAAKTEATYQKALSLEQNGEYAEAIKIYQTINGYKDSSERIAICRAAIKEQTYQEALTLEDNGDYAGAIKLYQTINGYKDSADRIATCQAAINEATYQKALSLEQNGKYEEALSIYLTIKGYKDSSDRIIECTYQKALGIEQTGDWLTALSLYNSIIEYKDTVERINFLSFFFTKFSEITPLYNGVSAYRLNNKWGLISAKDEKITEAEWDSFYAFSDGLARVQVNGKYGYVDTTGKFVIAPIYDRATPFSNGLAAVESDGLWGYIDTEGKYVLEPQWTVGNESYVGTYSEGKVNIVTPVGRFSKCGYIDASGKTIIQPQWEKAAYFSEGLAAVRTQSYSDWGYIDASGTLVIEEKWDYAYPFKDGIAVVRNDGYCGIDTSGKVVFSSKSTTAWDTIMSFQASEGMLIVRKKYPEGIKYGCIDTNGKVISTPQWDNMKDYSNGLSLVNRNGLYGYVDKQGKEVISLQWKWASSFSEGLAWVWDGNQWGLIDTSGNIVLGFGIHPSK